MARVNEGSHSFTCHPHVYPQVEWITHAFTPQPQSITALWLVLISRPTEGRRLSWKLCTAYGKRHCQWVTSSDHQGHFRYSLSKMIELLRSARSLIPNSWLRRLFRLFVTWKPLSTEPIVAVLHQFSSVYCVNRGWQNAAVQGDKYIIHKLGKLCITVT